MIKNVNAHFQNPIFINLLLPIGDNETYYKLSKSINQIKEDYAVARLLLVQSQFKRDDFNSISKRTTFVNTPDDSLFNLYIGLLKSSFKDIYNILDKIARFINEFFNLGLDENKSIHFTDIKLWNDRLSKNKWSTKLEISESNNPSLCALYDIYLDLDCNKGYHKNLRDNRNKLVHEKLVIHSINWNGKEG